jgi:hypothetical protein
MFVQIIDVLYIQGVGEAQSSNGTKGKRTPRPTGTSIVEGVYLNTKAPKVVQVQASNAVQPNGDSEVVGHGDDNKNIGDGEDQDIGYSWEDEDFGDGWEDEMDEEDRAGCVEGRIEPGMVSGFLHGEENRRFRSKVWNEFNKIRVAGIVTKGQCSHAVLKSALSEV